MKNKEKILIFTLLLLFLSVISSYGCDHRREGTQIPAAGADYGVAEDSCLKSGQAWYFAVEINGTLCGYATVRECTATLRGEGLQLESNEIFMKMSVLGQDMDNSIRILYVSDPLTHRLTSCSIRVRNGNSDIEISTSITGDTAWFHVSSSEEPKKILLGPDVILETGLRSPHLLSDFVQKGMNERRYKVFDPFRGEVIEKHYLKKGDTSLILAGSSFLTVVLEETDLSTGAKSTFWLNTADGMTVKTLAGNRNIYLADASIRNKIKTVNYDEVIVARVNKVIPEFSRVTRMKVRAKIETTGEIVTPEGLSAPGQAFTGTVKDNFIDGIFVMEPVRYDGVNAPPFPPDFTRDTLLKKYLEPELVIESDDPLLIAEATRITQGSANSWEAAKRLSKWVAGNIEGAIPGGISAINTYKMREGECGGHSRLLAAFCRAVGIPARLAIGCIYITKYGGSFAQHAWNEVWMGEAGWVSIDASLFEIDFVDAGHIRLGEKARFQPKEMEIIEFSLDNIEASVTDTIPPQFRPYLGKYTDIDRNRIFRILYQEHKLAVDIPGQMILPLEEPDETGQRYPTLTKQISISFRQNVYGKVESMVIRQKTSVSKVAPADSIQGTFREDLKQYAGRYRFPDGKTRELTESGGFLYMFDPIRRSGEPLKFFRDGDTWREETGMFEFGFESDDQQVVTRMTLYITFVFPRGEPAASIIEPIILESGATEGLRKYEAMKASGEGEYLYTEKLMNGLGYRLLSKDRTADAIEVFSYNAREFPDSFNVYDSLGEAYYKMGDRKLAIENFELSLRLNPGNENGKKMLEKIQSE